MNHLPNAVGIFYLLCKCIFVIVAYPLIFCGSELEVFDGVGLVPDDFRFLFVQNVHDFKIRKYAGFLGAYSWRSRFRKWTAWCCARRM